MNNLLNIKNITILFFITIFLLGLNLYQDYGVYFDNTYQRENALLWYSYVKSFFLEPSLSLADNLKNLIQQTNIKTINGKIKLSIKILYINYLIKKHLFNSPNKHWHERCKNKR